VITRVKADWLLGSEFYTTSEPKESEKRWLNSKLEHVAALPTFNIQSCLMERYWFFIHTYANFNKTLFYLSINK
jgi:hypothetical protein